MLGLSFSETGVILVVALIFLRPGDVVSFIKTFRKMMHFVRNANRECHLYVNTLLSESEKTLQKEKENIDLIGKKLEENLDISEKEKEKYKKTFKDIL